MLLDSLLGKRCRPCGRRSRLRPLGDFAATQPGPFHVDRFELVYCPRCEVVYLDPPPTPADLSAMYQKSVQFSDATYVDPERVRQILDYCTTSISQLGLQPPAGGRVLEVGAGLAWVSRACKALDPTIRTIAQDVSGEVADRCPWVDHYHVGELETLGDRGTFQLASMTHVIEHLVDPEAMLAQIAERLAPAGKLFVTAPFRPSGWRPDRGGDGWSDYPYLHVPAHVTYFSQRWFELVARRHGLRVARWDAGHEDGQAFELVLEKTA